MKKPEEMTIAELTSAFNDHAETLSKNGVATKSVKKFKDKPTGRRRLDSITKQVESLKKTLPKTKARRKPKSEHKRSGPKVKLTYAPKDVFRRPRDGTLSLAVLEACEADGGATIEEIEKVVEDFHKAKGNFKDLKLTTRYFACKAVSNLNRYNGFGFRRGGTLDNAVMIAYVNDRPQKRF